MFDWLFEARLGVLVLLFLVSCVFLYLWWQRRERRLLVIAGGVAGFALVYFLLSFLKETDREQIERKMHQMEQAVNERDLDRFSAVVSEDFRAASLGGMTKKRLHEQVRWALDYFDVRNAKIRGLKVVKVDRKARTATVKFRGTADNRTGFRGPIDSEADFVLEPDGQWRLKDLRFYRPIVDSQTPWNPFAER